MEHLEGIVKLAGNELKAIVDNGKFRSREEIDSVYKLMDIVKDAHCIWQYEDEESEYSEEGRSYDGSYARGGRVYRDGRYAYESYDDGMSYARGRGRNARRDSMGRYSRDYRGSYERGYSRDGKEEYKQQLMEMMETAPDEQARQSIKRMIDQM
jgi:hypothetical protein